MESCDTSLCLVVLQPVQSSVQVPHVPNFCCNCGASSSFTLPPGQPPVSSDWSFLLSDLDKMLFDYGSETYSVGAKTANLQVIDSSLERGSRENETQTDNRISLDLRSCRLRDQKLNEEVKKKEREGRVKCMVDFLIYSIHVICGFNLHRWQLSTISFRSIHRLFPFPKNLKL